MDRTSLLRALWLLNLTRLAPPDFRPDRLRAAYTARPEITHRVDVRDHLDAKRAAMRAHASQAAGGTDTRTLAYCLRYPARSTGWPSASRVRRARPAGRRPISDDIFAALR